MRYFLMIAGFLMGALSLYNWAIQNEPLDAHMRQLELSIFIASAVFFAIGAATVDIVQEIKRGRKGVGKNSDAEERQRPA